jgi:hypothetical protein
MGRKLWDNPHVKTLTADDRRRVQLPDAKPGQVFAYQNNGDGSLTLIEVKAEGQEPFPPGSLARYLTAERNKEQLALLKGCTLERP